MGQGSSTVKKLLSFLFLILLSACEERAQNKVPSPAQKQVLQIYLLTDANEKDPSTSLRFPNQEFFESSIPLRVERKTIQSLEEANETLREWNARPIDILFLGRGKPQESWQGTSLPRASGRLTVAWEAKQPIKEALSVHVLYSSLDSFLKSTKVYSHKKLSFDSRPDTELEIHLRWEELLPYLLKLRSQENPKALLIDAKSGLLEIRSGAAMSRKDSEAFKKAYKMWSLEQL
jgi:hypothetical protein